jgi:hypothetical protein
MHKIAQPYHSARGIFIYTYSLSNISFRVRHILSRNVKAELP